MSIRFEGFDWDDGNREKCRKHGVSTFEIESLFSGPVVILPDNGHAQPERRFNAIGKTAQGRAIFIVFTVRERDGNHYIRPISARTMHQREIDSYEKENPDL